MKLFSKKTYLDYLEVNKPVGLKRKISNYLYDPSKNSTPDIVVKKVINITLHLPRKLFRLSRIHALNNFYKEHQVEVKKILELSSDSNSKEVINSQIDLIKNYDGSFERIFLKNKGLLEKYEDLIDPDEYFPKGIIELSDSEVFVDCGAFDGDTVAELIKRTSGKFEHIYSFEADKINFPKLINKVNELGLSPQQITCFSKGVYSLNGQVHFNLKGIGSAVTEGGKEVIDVIRLDDFLSEEQKRKISFIKMDIEGSEVEALKGAAQIIKNNKPKLAICVYHKPEHFWEVPFLIKSIRPDYKIFFRQHALSRTDTVCYAV